MTTRSVSNCTLIIRSQAEYSASTQTVVLRCLLEKTTTGERRGFTEVDALLAILRAELLELQNQVVPPPLQERRNPAESDRTHDASDPAP